MCVLPVLGSCSTESVLLFLFFWQVLANSFVINRAIAVHHKAVISRINLLRKPFLIYCSKFSQAFETVHFFIVSLPEIF